MFNDSPCLVYQAALAPGFFYAPFNITPSHSTSLLAELAIQELHLKPLSRQDTQLATCWTNMEPKKHPMKKGKTSSKSSAFFFGYHVNVPPVFRSFRPQKISKNGTPQAPKMARKMSSSRKNGLEWMVPESKTHIFLCRKSRVVLLRKGGTGISGKFFGMSWRHNPCEKWWNAKGGSNIVSCIYYYVCTQEKVHWIFTKIYHIKYRVSYHVISNCILSHREILSFHIMSYHIISQHSIQHLVYHISYILSCHIISNHIMFESYFLHQYHTSFRVQQCWTIDGLAVSLHIYLFKF